MPVSAGGGSKAPKKAPPAPKPVPVKVAPVKNPGASDPRGSGTKPVTSGRTSERLVNGEVRDVKAGAGKAALQKLRSVAKHTLGSGAPSESNFGKRASRGLDPVKAGGKANAAATGNAPKPRRHRSGGVGDSVTRDGSRGTGGGNLGMPDRVGGSLRDPNLVGSTNAIDNYDGSQFSGGFTDTSEGGGGGSGSALAGRESSGRADVQAGDSLEDVVYGVQRRGRKVGRARGE